MAATTPGRAHDASKQASSRLHTLLHRALHEVQVVRQLLRQENLPIGSFPSTTRASCQTDIEQSDAATAMSQNTAAAAVGAAGSIGVGAPSGSCSAPSADRSTAPGTLHWTPIGVPRELRPAATQATSNNGDGTLAVPLSGLRRINTSPAGRATPPSSASSSPASTYPGEAVTPAAGAAADGGHTPSVLDTGRLSTFSAFSNDLFASDTRDTDGPAIRTPGTGFAGFGAAGRDGAGSWGTPATEWGSYASGGTPATALPLQLFLGGENATPLAGTGAIPPRLSAAAVGGAMVTPFASGGMLGAAADGAWGSAAPSAALSSAVQSCRRCSDPLRSLGAALTSCTLPSGLAEQRRASLDVPDALCEYLPGQDQQDLPVPAQDQQDLPLPCAPIASQSPRVRSGRPRGSDGLSGARLQRSSGGGGRLGLGRTADAVQVLPAGRASLEGHASPRVSGSGSAKAARTGSAQPIPYAAWRSSFDSTGALVVRKVSGANAEHVSQSVTGAGTKQPGSSGSSSLRRSFGSHPLKENAPPLTAAAPAKETLMPLARRSLPSANAQTVIAQAAKPVTGQVGERGQGVSPRRPLAAVAGNLRGPGGTKGNAASGGAGKVTKQGSKGRLAGSGAGGAARVPLSGQENVI